MLRHLFLISTAVIALAEKRNELEEKHTKPHIIYMMGDDQGWNDVSWHDNRVLTPNLEKLANNGVKFGNLYTMSACSPTRAALMTGRYASNIGAQHFVYLGLKPHGAPTYHDFLPKRLKDIGYSTYGVGKWHLGFCNSSYVPTGPTRGFDHFYGFYKGGALYHEHTSTEWGPGTPGEHLGYDLIDDGVPQRGPETSAVFNSELFQKKILSYIDGHNPEDPMFLYTSFQLPHTPRQVPKKWEDMYSCIPNDNRRLYCGQVTFMDAIAGSIVQALKDKGMYEDSLFIFHADNGGDVRTQASNHPYRGDKGTYFEGGIKAAGFISGKGIEKTGYTHEGLFHITDMYPTVVHGLLGEEIPIDLDGIDCWDAMSKGDPSPRHEMLITVDTDLADVEGLLGANVTAIRKDEWKLIIGYPAFSYVWKEFGWYPPQYTYCDLDNIPSPDGPEVDVRLYNLKHDPYEYNNVASEYPEVVADLREALKKYEETAWTFWPESTNDASPANFDDFWSPGWC